MKKFIAVAGLVVSLGLAPTFVTADEVITQRVQISDLNLASVEGQRALVKRLNRAIYEVCTEASEVTVSKLRKITEKRHCREQAQDSVDLQLADRGLQLQTLANRR